ncbi:hypothetical protein JOQ06_002980 [Pogonophryne albipinna]|uniref:C2H2-type domain-containing protein n=1 Tax=Pogonophryne albipinna TaxID=1090488 RepID=A0AAD6B6Y0_9TELE|nr:hypothetical protein JOQ06_002980 [Pogonophryne albipinna]
MPPPASPPRGVKRGAECVSLLLLAKLEGISEQQGAPETRRIGPQSCGHALTPVNPCPNYGSDRPHRRTALVAAELSRYNIDIAALSETRILDEGSLTEEGMGYTFFWIGYPSGGQHLHGNCFATLLSAYAPTLPSESEAKDSFYQSLDEALRRIPKNDKIFLLGDFNARVGQNSSIWSGVLGRHGVGQRCRMLDSLIMAKVHMQVRPPLRLQGPRRRRLDCTRLENPDARNEFRCSLAEKLGGMELSLSSSENTMDQKWNSISSALYEAAAQTIGYKSKNHQDWFDENSETIHDLRKDMHRAHRATLKSPSYLGSILSEDNTIDNEVQNRIKQASAAFGRLQRRVFQNKNLHLRTKVCVYQAICITTLLYSCEAWVTYSRHIRALEQFHIRCLQRILGITWRDRVPHSEVLSKTNWRSIEATITQHQLRWLGHVVRMPSNRLPRRVLYGQLHHGRRSAGGQKKCYKDQLKTALKKCKIRPEALEDAAADRNTWRQLCRDGTKMLEEERTARRQERRLRRNTPTVAVATATTYTCPTCNRICGSRIGLLSHQRTHR